MSEWDGVDTEEWHLLKSWLNWRSRIVQIPGRHQSTISTRYIVCTCMSIYT